MYQIGIPAAPLYIHCRFSIKKDKPKTLLLCSVKQANSKMEFAILAAGEGSRLANEGLTTPKPLVQLNGIPLLQRLIHTFEANHASKIHVIVNAYSHAVAAFVKSFPATVPINLLVKTTESSLHSFFELLPFIEGDKICLTTVDTVFDPVEFSGYIAAFNSDEKTDALMAATSFVDDEKPLFIQTTGNHTITGFFDRKEVNCNMVSGGIYCLRRPVFSTVTNAVNNGVTRMRNLQRILVKEGFAIKAFPFSKIIDIDHVLDIATAESWLHSTKHLH